ncbi:MAG: CGNR zinc finger domain-containing protein [Solirubrobacteraceae bacterium]
MNAREEAPGQLEQVRLFVNTLDREEAIERLPDAASLGAWLTEHGLAHGDVRATAGDLNRATQLREALRQTLLAHNEGDPAPQEAAAVLDAAAARARVRLRFDAGAHARLEAEANGVDGALGRLLAIVHAAMADGTWGRLKACREQACEWAYYDQTRNHSRAWCDMQVCGNRAKARTYRRRHAS